MNRIFSQNADKTAIAVNLTNNSYYVMEYGHMAPKAVPEQGDFDDLINACSSIVHPDERDKYARELARDHLLAMHGRDMSLEHRQLGEDGQYEWIMTSVLYVDNPNNTDMWAVMLSEYIPGHKHGAAVLQDAPDAAAHADLMVCIYDIPTRTCFADNRASEQFGIDHITADMPDALIRKGIFSGKSVQDCIAFFNRINLGEARGDQIFYMKAASGSQGCFRASFTAVFDDRRSPIYAIVLIENITGLYEKRLTYKNYLRSLQGAPDNASILYECNLTKNIVELEVGEMLPHLVNQIGNSFPVVFQYLFDHFMDIDDRKKIAFALSRERLLAVFENGVKEEKFEYRTHQKHWQHVTVQFVEDPQTADVKISILFENVDARKNSELELLSQAQIDGLTGLLNQETFAAQVTDIICSKAPDSRGFVFLILDLDHFITASEKFGRAVSNGILRDTATTITAMFGETALSARFGKDEFSVFLCNPPSVELLKEQMRILCSAIFKQFEGGIAVGVSIGIALCPDDGVTFEDLYSKAVLALFEAKRRGGSQSVFYSPELEEAGLQVSGPPFEINEKNSRRIFVRTFGYFEVFIGDKPIHFKLQKAKELLALLVDRRGGFVKASEAISCLWEDEPEDKTIFARYRKVAMRLREILEDNGIADIIENSSGARRVNPNKFDCDYYRYLSGDPKFKNLFRGSYMSNYSWGESTLAELDRLLTNPE